MKKILSITLCLATVFSLVATIAVPASAMFGYGYQVVASGVNVIKTGLKGQKICFSDADFKSALVLSDFDSITITKIPSSTEGTLLLNGRRVGQGRVIKRKNIGGLIFLPASDSVTECSFKFTVAGYSSGTEIECIMKFIDKVNYEPEAIGDITGASNIYTQSSISVFGNIAAIDPEGDEIEYIIVSYPKNGILTLTDNDGKYCYTPYEGFTGKDKFVYVARDEYGNYSVPMTVNVKVESRMCETEYRDMESREEYNAAVAMTAMGVMNGKRVGDDMYFLPDETITRAELVSMAMKAVGIKADSTLNQTCFDDDSEIASSLKGYIATAQRIGIISGDFTEGKLIFSPNEEITRYEAAKIISMLIGSDSNGEESVFAEENNIPVWARAGVYTMCSLGIFDSRDQESLSDKVTRGDIAEYLYKLIKNK